MSLPLFVPHTPRSAPLVVVPVPDASPPPTTDLAWGPVPLPRTHLRVVTDATCSPTTEAANASANSAARPASARPGSTARTRRAPDTRPPGARPAGARPATTRSPDAGRPLGGSPGSDPTVQTLLPDPAAWAARLALALLEVSAGFRPATHVMRYCAPEVFEGLVRRQLRGTTRRPVLRVRRVRVCAVRPDAVETSVVVADRRRVRAMALRLEAVDGRWVVTTLLIG